MLLYMIKRKQNKILQYINFTNEITYKFPEDFGEVKCD